MIRSQFNLHCNNSWMNTLTHKLQEDKLTMQLIALSGLLGHLCSEECLKIPVIMDFNQMITNPSRIGLWKQSSQSFNDFKNQNVLKPTLLMMVKLMWCLLNSDSLPQLTISSIQLHINSTLNLLKVWLSEIFSNFFQMLINSKTLLWDIMKISTTNNSVILLHLRLKCSAHHKKRLSYFYKCTFTIFHSRSEIMWMTANLSWIRVEELWWVWLMLQNRKNFWMRQEQEFIFNKQFIKVLDATFLT